MPREFHHREVGSFSRGFGQTFGCFAAVGVALLLALIGVGACLFVGKKVYDETAPSPAAATDATKSASPVRADPLREQIGNIEITVESAAVGPVPLMYDSRRTTSERPRLMIGVRVANRSKELKRDFRRWEDSIRSFATLEDEKGNRYKMSDFGITLSVIGAAVEESIYPGKATTDLLVFEPPVDVAGTLTLTLDAERVGEKGKFTFRISTAGVKPSKSGDPVDAVAPGDTQTAGGIDVTVLNVWYWDEAGGRYLVLKATANGAGGRELAAGWREPVGATGPAGRPRLYDAGGQEMERFTSGKFFETLKPADREAYLLFRCPTSGDGRLELPAGGHVFKFRCPRDKWVALGK